MSVTRSLLFVQELDSHLVKRFLYHVTRNSVPSGRLVGPVRGAGLRSLHCGAPALQGLGAGSTPLNAETITSFRSPASYRRVHAALATPQEEELFEPSHGPDQVLPARSHKCWHPDGAVTLTMDEEGPGARAPMSVHSLLQTAVLAHPQQPALAVHRDDAWKYWNYAEYYAASATAAKALIRLGLQRFHSVCIMGANSPEWVIANNGAIMAGGLSTGLYNNNSAEASCGIANDCRAQVLVLDNHHTVSSIMTVRHKLPHVKAFVQWLGQPRERGVMSWAEFMHLGASTPDDELQQRLSLQAVNQCCSLIYTSGTTGPPKGVMCSQDNITWSARAIAEFFSLKHDDSIVSYLPLNHIAAQMVDLYVAMPAAGTVYFAKPDALKGSLFDTIKDVQPTEFLTVPRLLEKIHEQLTAASAESSPAKRAVAAWAKREGSNYYRALREGRRLTQKEQLRYRLAKMLVFSKVKKALGLTNCRNLTSGSAPLSPELVEFFFSLDLPQSNVWALSESCGIGTINHLHEDRYRTGSVGKAVPGAKISIQKSDVSSRQGEGEICMKGRNVFMGYFNNKEKTDETIQDDGWMRTGDLGHLDEDGFLYVSGRAKEIIITAGGENIAPLPIEAAVKKLIPAVANAVVVGDGKKYLSMLLTFCCSVDPDTMVPHDSLSAPALDWLRGLGSAVTTVTQLRDEVQQQPNGIIATAIQAAIDVYNSEHATSRIHQLKRWSVLPHDFSLATGELNNTLKLKRSYVTEKYSELIEEIYSR